MKKPNMDGGPWRVVTVPAVGCCVSPTNLAAGFLFEEVLA